MEAGPGPRDRPRMDVDTFRKNFGPQMPKETHLCYEWNVPEGDTRVPADQLKGFLRNKSPSTAGVRRHAELCFLDLINTWGLDRDQHYSVTLFISWSPCPDCALSLVKFLQENSHVSLRIRAARIYRHILEYEDGLRQLRAAGAEVSIMKVADYQHIWETFVDPQEQPFQPEDDLQEHIQQHSQMLDAILQGN